MDTTTVRLRLFGSPTVEHAGGSLALPFERRHQLVALLALRRGWVPRAELAPLLWPEHTTHLAYANLRKALFRLQAMPWAAAVETQGAALRFQVATDVFDFENALREQRPGAALAAYRGELLAGFDDGQSEGWTQWLRFERDRLRAAWRGVALAQLGDEGFAPADAIALSARLLEADPLDEAALRANMAALSRDGQAPAARQAWQRFVDRMADELGLEPGPELVALREAVGSTSKPAAARPSPVSPADDGFVGRSIELRRIGDLLSRPECRLLCLIGPGGVGKTRLARRAAHELSASFADGAVFVTLEDIDTPAQFGLKLADEAGVARGRRSGDALAMAVQSWRERRLLLVLDNFEPLAGEAPALLQRLLQGCPQLKILVTSRVRLTVADEWSMPVEGLPCPDPEDDDRAESFDAVRLFVQQALRVAPDFSAHGEGPAIVDICRLVEGLPLALELAASWVRVLSCQAIADELRQGTELLQARDAAHPPRHASVEMVFDHSWNRLSEVERTVLAKLSVFQGGFTAEAARAVAGASLPALGALTDKSLLARSGDRLRLHPLVQQLAGLRLEGFGDRRATELAHAAYFHRWLEQLKPAVEDGRRSALAPIDAELENIRRAWRVATREGQGEVLMRNARTVLSYCDYRGRADEGLAWLRETIASPLGQSDVALHALLLSQASHLEYRLGRYEDATASATQALEQAGPKNDHGARMQALTVLASCALQEGRLPDARRFYKQALAQASAETLAHHTAATLDNLALVEKRMGHYDESRRLSIESLAQHRRIGDQAGVALCLNNLANVHLLMHEFEVAAAHLEEALAICEREGLVSTLAYVLSSLADMGVKAGDVGTAERHAARAVEVASSTGNRPVWCWMTLQRARLALRRGELEAARELLAAGAATTLELKMPTLRARALLAFAELMDAQQEPAVARRVLGFAVEHPSITTMDRDELRAEWVRRAVPPQHDPPWPGLELEELLRRIVSEREQAHAPMIAVLKGGS